jgi:signal transduction histidine kinase
LNLLKAFVRLFYTYSNERKIQFSVIAETQSIQMKFDPDKIRKIMFNLLSNAFKFTPEYGNIEVGIYADPNHAGVKISDTGCGISENDKKHIFERFYQVADDGQKTGSGIGLHIVSEYVKMHGGSITVIDNNPKGSIFEFKIPFKDVVLNDDSDLTDEETETRKSSMKRLFLFYCLLTIMLIFAIYGRKPRR